MRQANLNPTFNCLTLSNQGSFHIRMKNPSRSNLARALDQRARRKSWSDPLPRVRSGRKNAPSSQFGPSSSAATQTQTTFFSLLSCFICCVRTFFREGPLPLFFNSLLLITGPCASHCGNCSKLGPRQQLSISNHV